MEFEFLFVVQGVTVDDEQAVKTLTEEFDAQLSWHRGLSRLAVCAEGGEALDAFHTLLPRLAQALPELHLLHLDPDLVGVSDIAARTERTRQNVQQWIDGERSGERPFPPPEGTVGRSLAWRWAEVNAWLEPLGLSDGENRPTREQFALMDVTLISWRDSRAKGLPLLKFVTAGDERLAERQAVAARLAQAVADPALVAAMSTWPRQNQHKLVVVCAVPLDPLKFVVEQLEGDSHGVFAVLISDTELHLSPIACKKFPGSVPISMLGLSTEATVGDLVLAQRVGRVVLSQGDDRVGVAPAVTLT